MDATETMGGVPSERHAEAGEAGLVLAYAPVLRDVPAVVVLQGGGAVIGREPPASGVTIAQKAVSRLHAKVSRSGEGWVVSDLGSRNGVIVNGRRVQQAVLAPQDVVRIGDAIFVFVAEEARAYGDLAVEAPGAHADAGLVGGRAIGRLFEDVERIAKTDLSVLVHGETGTGKEIASRAIHARSGRKGKLCALNCAAIPANLVESELFGVKRGAYTGADRDRLGLVRTAHGGTLLLDEIGDMPLEAQAKLLRMLETREVVPVGGTEGEKVDVRVVCATHRDLRGLVAAGSFRGDLLARINGYTLTLPPLRNRREDVYRLVISFLAKHGRPEMTPTLRFMVAAIDYDWPYNVRELEGAVRRALAVAEGKELDTKHLPVEIAARLDHYGVAPENAAQPSRSETSAPTARAPTAEELRALLAEHAGNVAAVGRVLGKDRQQIHRWMRMHGIKPDDFRG